MDRVLQTRVQVAPGLVRSVLLSALALGLGCGGNTGRMDPADTGGASAGGGSGASSFGAGGAAATAGTGGNGATGGVKNELAATGGEVTQTSPDDPCNWRGLSDALAKAVDGGECVYLQDGSAEVDSKVYWIRGTAVLDDEGRIIDFVGSQNEQYWLDHLSNQRWPCQAGLTVEYACMPRRL